MNFVGHAMVARWEHDRAEFVLGAMLPDFERMCGTRLTAVHDERVAAGIACHHRVDAAFHDSPTFLALMADARRDLRAHGLPRPTVLAGAHVGVELLLDGAFIGDPDVLTGYLAAVAAGPTAAAHLRWQSDDGPRQFSALCARIGHAEAPRAYADPHRVAQRLCAVLGRRPRLAPGPGGAAALQDWAVHARASVHDAAPTVIAELRATLS